MLCQGITRIAAAQCIWRSWAPLKCKIFAWLASQYRLWTSDRRARHGLQDTTSACYRCYQEEDTTDHIRAGCVYARQLWDGCFRLLQINVQIPSSEDTFMVWWDKARKFFHGKLKRGFDSLVILTAWHLWKQRNAKVFNRPDQWKGPRKLVSWILEDIFDWRQAGVGVGGLDRFVRH